jgi:hypothetical protein
MTIAPPSGDLLDDEVRAAEAIVDRSNLYGREVRRYSFVIQLEDGDAEAIEREGGRFLLTFLDHVAPFDVQVVER